MPAYAAQASGGGDAGHHFEGDAVRAQEFQFLAAATEHERIAALQPHHAPAGARVFEHQRVDVVLGHADGRRLPCPLRCARHRVATARSTSALTRRSCRITSASFSARSACRVSSPGSPGPAPTSATEPASVSTWLRRAARLAGTRQRRRRQLLAQQARQRAGQQRLEEAAARRQVAGSARGCARDGAASSCASVPSDSSSCGFQLLAQMCAPASARRRRWKSRSATGRARRAPAPGKLDSSASSTTLTKRRRASPASATRRLTATSSVAATTSQASSSHASSNSPGQVPASAPGGGQRLQSRRPAPARRPATRAPAASSACDLAQGHRAAADHQHGAVAAGRRTGGTERKVMASGPWSDADTSERLACGGK